MLGRGAWPRRDGRTLAPQRRLGHHAGMLARLKAHLLAHPAANSHELALALGWPLGLLERALAQLEDEGFLVLEHPAACLEGPGCGPQGGCGPAPQLEALAQAARARRQGQGPALLDALGTATPAAEA